MKRFIVIFLVLATVLAAGCVKKHAPHELTPEEQADIADPRAELTSIDQVNAACGAKILRLETATNEVFAIIAGEYMLGEYSFTAGGADYVLRAAKTEEDITGVEAIGALPEAGSKGEVEPTAFGGGVWSRWFDGEVQYTLVSENADIEQFAAVDSMFH